MDSLIGRRALITGGGSGIGKAIAQDLVKLGVQVNVCGRRKMPLATTISEMGRCGDNAKALVADVTKPDDVKRLVSELLKPGPIDILINNAGFSSKIRSARHVGAREWRDVMDVNTLGPVMLTQGLIGPMIERGSGDVIMIASVAGLRPSVMAGAAYSSAKSAARAYMDVLRQEVSRSGIRCISVFPGEVDTPILDNRALIPGHEERAVMMQSTDISHAVCMALSMPRRATVSEIVLTATYPRDLTADIAAALKKKNPT